MPHISFTGGVFRIDMASQRQPDHAKLDAGAEDPFDMTLSSSNSSQVDGETAEVKRIS